MPLQIIRDDITKVRCDAIVNAAKNSLLGGGGVDGAIHAAAGPALLEACRPLGGCATGDAKITPGFRLPARYVIHTVGPRWNGGRQGEPELLRSCYRRSLELAREYQCESVAFPLISAGIFGYPRDQALKIAVDTIGDFLLENDMTVYIVVYNRNAFLISQKLFSDVRAYIDDVYVDAHTDHRREAIRRREGSVLLHDFGSQGAALPTEDFADGAACVSAPKASAPTAAPKTPASAPSPPLEELLRQTDESFAQMLLRKIDESGMTDAQCYKKANIDRKLFSKIRNDPMYRPSKPTAIAFAIALELSLDETRDLLSRAGFALSHASRFDIIIEYFIQNRCYNIYEINEVLFQFDQSLLGA